MCRSQTKTPGQDSISLTVNVDTGADVNLMSKDVYVKMSKDVELKQLRPNDIKLGAWGHSQISLLGKFIMYVIHPDRGEHVETVFYVEERSGCVLLSCGASLRLNLINCRPKLGRGTPDKWSKIIEGLANHIIQ